jgi:hypothetical protein
LRTGSAEGLFIKRVYLLLASGRSGPGVVKLEALGGKCPI